MPPAARICDEHICPHVSEGASHLGGPVVIGAPTVIIGMMPAARAGDAALCVGPADAIVMGSTTVKICGAPAARLGDQTAHGGTIVTGFPTVMIGG